VKKKKAGKFLRISEPTCLSPSQGEEEAGGSRTSGRGSPGVRERRESHPSFPSIEFEDDTLPVFGEAREKDGEGAVARPKTSDTLVSAA